MAAQHGSKAYAVLLCYSSDQPDTAPRRPPSYFTDLFINSPKGMNAYWREVVRKHHSQPDPGVWLAEVVKDDGTVAGVDPGTEGQRRRQRIRQ